MTRLTGIFLGVRNAVTGTHQVELTGPDGLLGAERITMQKLALKEPRHGLEATVGVRGDVGALAGAKCEWTEMISKTPRTHTAPCPRRQRTADLKEPDVRIARANQFGAGTFHDVSLPASDRSLASDDLTVEDEEDAVLGVNPRAKALG